MNRIPPKNIKAATPVNEAPRLQYKKASFLFYFTISLQPHFAGSTIILDTAAAQTNWASLRNVAVLEEWERQPTGLLLTETERNYEYVFESLTRNIA